MSCWGKSENHKKKLKKNPRIEWMFKYLQPQSHVHSFKRRNQAQRKYTLTHTHQIHHYTLPQLS